MTEIAANYHQVLECIAQAAHRSGRNPEQIQIVAVSKMHPASAVVQAYDAGLVHIGESKVREAEDKFTLLFQSHPDIKIVKHLIGHLQTNKVKTALHIFDLIHSVDSLHLGKALSAETVKAGIQANILVQVNTSGEISKFGVIPEQAIDLTAELSQLPGLNIQGLMTIGAFLPEPEQVRPCFVTLRQLSENIAALRLDNVEMKYLSMGMTGDFEIAIEEGANLLRIGTALFGERNPAL